MLRSRAHEARLFHVPDVLPPTRLGPFRRVRRRQEGGEGARRRQRHGRRARAATGQCDRRRYGRCARVLRQRVVRLRAREARREVRSDGPGGGLPGVARRRSHHLGELLVSGHRRGGDRDRALRRSEDQGGRAQADAHEERRDARRLPVRGARRLHDQQHGLHAPLEHEGDRRHRERHPPRPRAHQGRSRRQAQPGRWRAILRPNRCRPRPCVRSRCPSSSR